MRTFTLLACICLLALSPDFAVSQKPGKQKPANAANQTNPTDAKNTRVESAPPVTDEDFTRYAIYEATAPRPQSTEPRSTTLPLPLSAGDRIAFIGNTLFERAQDYGFFEGMVQQQNADKKLVFRHLAWSADEVGVQPRPDNFADTEQHLAHEKADVIFAAFGFNESFAGEEGLAKFRASLTEYLAGLKSKAFNGKSSPRIVLVSPIANENM